MQYTLLPRAQKNLLVVYIWSVRCLLRKRTWSSNGDPSRHHHSSDWSRAPSLAAWSRHMNVSQAGYLPSGGRGTECHWHYTPLTFLYLGRPPTHKGIVLPNVIVSPPQTSRRTQGSRLTISRTPMPLS
ncbi:hypothetical protein DPMN_145954 [Dreissena polymorpha]|uniref:Uncharacterized protein n=1 Tax=Dreissena polymorpha TaxID=45954 RepID=A0A9D4J1V4_DREPO|nr:hypothetical protein DPMN_145954 [Dreissena polymorpha]